jgi:ATP-binding cassette, subfamily B, bacterial MsbA
MLRLIRHFLRYLGGVRGTILLGLLTMVLASLLAGANIGLIYPFFEGVFLRPPSAAPADAAMGWVASLGTLLSELGAALGAGDALKVRAGEAFDAFLGRHDRLGVLLLLCGLTLALATTKIVALYLYRICFVQVEQTLVRELRNDLFRQLQEQSIDLLQRHRQGELISRLIGDVMVVRTLTITKVADLLMNLLQSLTYLALALFIDWRLTLLSVLVLAPAVASFQYIGQKLRTYSRRAQEQIARVTERLAENLQGFRVVQAFFAREREIQRFNEATQGYFRRVRKLDFVGAFSSPFAEWASTLVAVFMLWYGGTRVLAAEASLSPAAFLTFLAALLAMLHPLKIVARSWNELQKGTGAGDRLLELLGERPSIVEAPAARPVPGFSAGLEFDGVGFAYGDEPVLVDIRFTLRKGEFVALVGASGSGKTTLANLALRLIDPGAGCLRLDGVDIRGLKLGQYRRLFGVVGQETWLFHLSVAENVAYPEAVPDRGRVLEALRMANALDFVEAMGGLDASVGEGGLNLSGGQRQRLAIARAVYRRPEILVFDEATSALDTESEQLVQEALDRSVGERTALVIAHRLSTVIRADRIICMKAGRIAGIGPHAELLADCPEYRKLYELQFRT